MIYSPQGSRNLVYSRKRDEEVHAKKTPISWGDD